MSMPMKGRKGMQVAFNGGCIAKFMKEGRKTAGERKYGLFRIYHRGQKCRD